MHIGFKKLKNMLAKSGAQNPGAVAASIGNKKYGKDKMQKAAQIGKPIKVSQKK